MVFEEVTMNEGDFRHVSQEVRHAWKNRTNELAVAVIVNFEVSQIFSGGRKTNCCWQASKASISRGYSAFRRPRAARYHYWLASPEENAAVGINLLG
jgi:hypothetical protein